MRESVSVIIPVGNDVFLRQAVDSVLRQKNLLELILVDDGVGVFRKDYRDNRIRIIKNKTRRGPAVSRNRGLAAARGKYIAFLDADDWWHENFLEMVLKKLADSDSTAVVCLSEKKYEVGISLFGLVKAAAYNLLKDLLLVYSYLTNRKMLHSSAPFLTQISHMLFNGKRLRGLKFDPDYKYCEDWKFVLDLTRRGSVMILPRRLITFRYSPASNTMTTVKSSTTNKAKYYKKIFKLIVENYQSSLYLRMFQVYTRHFLIKTL